MPAQGYTFRLLKATFAFVGSVSWDHTSAPAKRVIGANKNCDKAKNRKKREMLQ